MRSVFVFILSKRIYSTVSSDDVDGVDADAGTPDGMKKRSVTSAITARVVTPKNLRELALIVYMNIAVPPCLKYYGRIIFTVLLINSRRNAERYLNHA